MERYAEDLDTWRGEPETVDVHAQQGEVDWSREPVSDDQLSPHVRQALGLPGAPRKNPGAAGI